MTLNNEILNKETLNKDEIVLKWAMMNPYLTDALLMGYLAQRPGACAIIPLPTGESGVGKRYINGDRITRYDFMLQVMFPFSETTDSVNADNFFTQRQWMDWIDEQERIGNYPDFGPDCSEYELRNMAGGPQLSQVYDDGMAQYQFPASLIYLEKKR